MLQPEEAVALLNIDYRPANGNVRLTNTFYRCHTAGADEPNTVFLTTEEAQKAQKTFNALWPPNPLAITLADSAWQKDIAVNHLLRTTISLNGMLMHVEAWEMRLNKKDEYVPVNAELRDDYDDLYAGIIRDGAPKMLEISGKPYFVTITPGR